MDEETKRQINRMTSAFTLSLKLGRVYEITRKLRLLGFDSVSVEKVVGKGIRDAVRNFNDSIGQKV